MHKKRVPAGRQKKIIDKFSTVSILVVGDVIIDQYLWGDVLRISPEAPVPVVNVISETFGLGGAANVVQNLKSIAAHPQIVALRGTDANGAVLMNLFRQQDCPAEGIAVSESRPTTIKTRIMARHQQIVRADREIDDPLSRKETALLWNNIRTILPKVDGVIVSDYGKGVVSRLLIRRLVEQCRKDRIHIAVDPKERHFELYKRVDMITPNLREAHAALGIPYRHCTIEEVRALGWKLMSKLKPSSLLITLSEQGMALFESRKKKFTHLPTAAVKVFDVTGAGDTVISTYAAATAAGATPLEAAWIANNAAGLTVAEPGTACVTPQELIEACKKSQRRQN
ncbi:MAG: D-glycero-beta-D-manno-heptose-7-phosphate kinase [Chitinivibrionales bacterium]|nr:D-glycero-beta-D-manno-heptose-7-phosphate kinase [Chitinivibrionales bacterium]